MSRRVPSPAELVRLATALGDGYGPMAWLGAVVGMRWGEVAGLRVGRLDFLRSIVMVSEGSWFLGVDDQADDDKRGMDAG